MELQETGPQNTPRRLRNLSRRGDHSDSAPSTQPGPSTAGTVVAEVGALGLNVETEPEREAESESIGEF